MISQLPGACIRALLVVAMVLTPSLLLPETNAQISDAVILIAFFAALLVIVEYGASCPDLIDFRSAPPFNRVRFVTLFATLTLIALAIGARTDPSLLARLILAVGVLLGQAMDVPLSPIRLVMWLLPEGASPAQEQALRAAAGLAYLVSLVGLTVFAILIRVRGWPSRSGTFNLWINLPTFDARAGGDVVVRLRRNGAVNIILGLLLPYLTPPLAVLVAGFFGLSILQSDLMLVWVMALWAFVPTTLFLRGIAMRRLALMISDKRRRLGLADGVPDPAFLPA